MSRPVVHVVHCVDTEGPLYESLGATFQRLRDTFHLDLEPSRELLADLQAGRVDLGGREEDVRRFLSPRLLSYNSSWDQVDAMLAETMAGDYRLLLPDSHGRGWVFNWFCLDHVDFDVNPRRRALGYHVVFDHYADLLAERGETRDALHFHFHPQHFLRHAHRCATHWWANSGKLFQVLARRIIDRGWFPAVNRPGFQVNRPDSHWFLEQFIPFDLASLATSQPEDPSQFDVTNGRSGDWRRAPVTWEPYHPSHDDYQTPGSCRRWIGRCLNIGTRFANLTAEETRTAFEEARQGKPVVLAFADHDARDYRPDLAEARALLADASALYPDVDFVYCEAAQAMRSALGLPALPACDLDLDLRTHGDAHVLTVRTAEPSFGPQPFLALKTVTGHYLHDNFDFQIPNREWTYVFDVETLPLKALETVGVAVNNAVGVTTVARLDAVTGRVRREVLNPVRPLEGP